MGNAICHWEIMGQSGLSAFYTKVFDWKVESMMPGYDMVSHGDDVPLGGGLAGSDEGQTGICVYFAVDSLEETLAAAEAAGGKTVQGKTAIPGHGHFALFSDPDGNVIGIHTEH